MNYTRTALGLLSAQYRSVLKKCFLINLGLFALGAAMAAPAGASIDDYTGLEYTGKGTKGATSPLYFKWQQDTDLNIYKLVTTTATDADIIVNDRDEYTFGDDDGFPGYDPETGELVGVVYGDLHTSSNYFLQGQTGDTNLTVDGVYVGGNINNVRGDYVWPIGNGINTNIVGLKSVNGIFLGNNIVTSSDMFFGPVDFASSAYGGAIFNSSVNVFAAIATLTPEAAGVIGKISGEFIANGVTITEPCGYHPVTNLEFDDYRIGKAWFTEGAFGGAIANLYGTIGEITGTVDTTTGAVSKVVFENNYVISTATSAGGVPGNVGGAAIYNAVRKFWKQGIAGYREIPSSIGNITADFTENVANTAYGEVWGGTILNYAAIGPATIGNINGNFTKNSAVAQDGSISGSVIGNMTQKIDANQSGTATIGIISGTFSQNTATASDEIYGLIYNDDTIAGIENSVFDANTGAADAIYGGVIANYGTITNGIKNTIFTDNTFTADTEGLGAAIYTVGDLIIAADGADGKTMFKGNTINDVANAVYMDNADLTIAATDNGTVTFYDTIDGENAAVVITGDASGKVQIYNDISNSDVTAELVNIETTDDNGESHNYALKSLTSDANAKWTIDFNISQESADTFETAAASSGRVTLEALNLTGGEYADITDDTFKIQILKTQGTAEDANLQLALGADLEAELATKFVMGEETEIVDDEVTTDTNWSDEFMHTVKTTKKEGWLGLATTDTLNDSIGINVDSDTEETKTKLGDTLKLVNTARLAKRNFNADQGVYKVTDGYDDIGTTYGELTVNGQSKEESVLDANGAALFDLSDENTKVTLKNVKVKNAKTVAKLVAPDAVLNLENVELSDNQEGIENNGTVNISGVNKITDDISGNGTTNVNSDWEMESKISGNTVNVNNAKLTIGKDNLDKTVSLRVANGGDVSIGKNIIGLKRAVFESGSQLTLNIDDLDTFGGIRADSFEIAPDAKLDITFGQDVLHGETKGRIPLLALTDGTDIHNNNFINVFHNNMYGFDNEAAKSGIYTIKLKKTAREVSAENGGTTNNQDEAGAWVDGPSHNNPEAQQIADDLARLAQTDGVAFNRELTAISPADSAVMSFLGEINNRVFYIVDNHLRNDTDKSAPNETVQEHSNSNGVSVWVKPYYGQSKHQRTGKVYGFDTKSYGIVAGVDKQLNKDVRLGVGGRYEEADMNTFRKDYDISTSTVFGYGEYKPSAWFINGVVKYDVSDWDEKRYALGRTVKANYSTDVYSTQLTGGYEYNKNAWNITPQAGLRWHHIHRHGYVDSAWQKVSGRTMDVLSGTVGLHLQKDAKIRGEKFHPDLYAGIAYDFVSDRDQANISLTNGTQYVVRSERLNRLAVEISPSISYDLSDNVSVNVQYTGAFREHYQNHTADIGLKYEF